MYNEFTPLLRVYRYSDTERGYGDNGTFKYVRVSEDEFDLIIHTRKYDGTTYEERNPTPELMERLKAVGYNYYSMGFEFATEEEYNEELTELREKLKRLENIR